MRKLYGIVCFSLVAWTLGACASAPEVYQPTAPHYAASQLDFGDSGPQIERGRPNALLDGINHYVLSLPTKLLLWNWKVLDHDLPERNRGVLERYLVLNQMRSVKVRHNQYDPLGEFGRLIDNEEVGVAYRMSLGLFSWLLYTLVPGRLFAGVPLIGVGDHFNPFTNTVHVYSSDLGVLLHEGGHAKDYLQHESKGTSFALFRLLPGVDLLQEAAASTDAIRFLQCIGEREEELRAYRTLIPAYSTYIAGYVPGGLEFTLPVVLMGHVSGRIQAYRRARQMQRDDAIRDVETVRYFREVFLPEWCAAISEQEDSS